VRVKKNDHINSLKDEGSILFLLVIDEKKRSGRSGILLHSRLHRSTASV